MIDKMGSAKKLATEKRGVKTTASRPSEKKEVVFTTGKNMGRILGPYVPWRSPFKFYYAKKRRSAPGYRASFGYRDHYSLNWRKFILITKEQMTKVFSITAGKIETCKRYKDKVEASKETEDRKNIVLPKDWKAPCTKLEFLTFTEEKPAVVSAKDEKPADVKTECTAERIETPVKIKKTEQVEMSRTEKTGIRQAVSENVKTGETEPAKNIVVKQEKIQTVKTDSVKNVPKTVGKRSNAGRIYKPVATTKRPRTSTKKMHAEIGRRKVERPADTSNNVFAGAVRPFSLLSASVKLLKMKPEGVIKTVEIKVPETKHEVKTEEKDDSYHALNRARHKLLFPKIASGAADSLN